MNHTFGPVPSRRLGRSLGIDTVPLKTCNWNCAYCQLGRSRPLVGKRRAWSDPQQILDEVSEALKHHSGEYDWVTFVGSGEGTLHSDFGYLVQEVKQLSDKPVAVITNGSTLLLDDIREGLAMADAVMPTLDTANADTFRKLIRPRPELTLDRHIEGLSSFASMKKNSKLCIEVMMVSGINDTEEELHALAEVLNRLEAEQIHLVLPTRCPAENWVRVPETEALLRAQAILGERASLMDSDTVAVNLRSSKNPPEALADIVTRHPLRLTDAWSALKASGFASEHEIGQIIEDLRKSGRVEIARRFGVLFLTAAGLNRGKNH